MKKGIKTGAGHIQYPINAACQCGQVTYTLTAAPIRVLACHCTECQKLATSPFSISAIVASKDISFRGEMNEWQRNADSGNKNVAAFCPRCGNRIYHYNPDAPALIRLKLKPASKRSHTLFKPDFHCWVSEKQSWFDIPAEETRYQGQPSLSHLAQKLKIPANN